jgi:hypothetical protein
MQVDQQCQHKLHQFQDVLDLDSHIQTPNDGRNACDSDEFKQREDLEHWSLFPCQNETDSV